MLRLRSGKCGTKSVNIRMGHFCPPLWKISFCSVSDGPYYDRDIFRRLFVSSFVCPGARLLFLAFTNGT
jgi:hypothetical protein